MSESQLAALLRARRRDATPAEQKPARANARKPRTQRTGQTGTERGSGPEKRMAATLKIAGVQGWEREFAFHPVRGWRFDFAWPDALVALEIEGGVFSGGRHSRGAGIREDMTKYNEAQLLGWMVIRVLPEWIKKGRALLLVERALALRTPRTGTAGTTPRSTAADAPTGERSTATPPTTSGTKCRRTSTRA